MSATYVTEAAEPNAGQLCESGVLRHVNPVDLVEVRPVAGSHLIGWVA